jgi:predicted Zn finger-like uncharacterized protein
MATGLATRCTACQTVFRVVPDQLRVSEGWVRCGKCSEVFNALEGLIDLETGSPQRSPGRGWRRHQAMANWRWRPRRPSRAAANRFHRHPHRRDPHRGRPMKTSRSISTTA